MAFTLNDGQGTLHKNKTKDEGSKQPDYRGDVMIHGELLDIAAWIKDGKAGKWMSLKVQPKREQTQQVAAINPDADIPF